MKDTKLGEAYTLILLFHAQQQVWREVWPGVPELRSEAGQVYWYHVREAVLAMWSDEPTETLEATPSAEQARTFADLRQRDQLSLRLFLHTHCDDEE